MNLLLEKSRFVDFYTYLGRPFAGIPRLAMYNYLITDLETNVFLPRFEVQPVTISGAELRDILALHEVQFIWGVLSAFDRDVRIPDQHEWPYADGNPDLWTAGVKPQASGALFEIVCWDSGSTLFIGVDAELAASLRELYPDIRDLDEYNAQTR